MCIRSKVVFLFVLSTKTKQKVDGRVQCCHVWLGSQWGGAEVLYTQRRSPNAPINSKLQHPPPRAYPGHLTVHRAQGGGNLDVALEGWGI